MEYVIVIAAVVVGGVAVFLLLRRQAKGDAPGCCGGCPYGRSPTECAPPENGADAPDGCEKYE
ncbi:MAG TPA: hypothetical protein VMW93_02480 [bacterium]|nr:hypothetical protein [bacterium]